MFIQIIQGKCTRENDMRAALDRWSEQCEPGAEGFLGGTYGFTDDNMFVGVVRFENEDLARRNSNRPEQDAWWRETEQLFAGPVEFHESSNVALMMEGGSDRAGFVQVIRGRVDEPERVMSTMQETDALLHQARPDILGATIAIEPDGWFTETVAFTDEATARENESKEMPAELRERLEQLHMHDMSYLDLHRPWFRTHTTT